MNPLQVADVVIVGGGPAGLTAAATLAADDALNIVVLERESQSGGIPRHSDHPGYGMRDMKTFISGPAYARRLVDAAVAAGAVIRTSSTVTGWADRHTLEVTSPDGRYHMQARAVILATGARERPRAARLIPGDRAHGVYTTGHLQNLVHLKHRDVGSRAVVVGAELVSYSAILTLKHAGCRTALMTTTFERPESYGVFNLAARTPLLGVDIATRTRVSRIIGKPTVTGVEIENIDSGVTRTVDCDTVVLTGDWIPDNELARSAGLEIDRGSRSPVVDTALRTSSPGVFAIGNLLHPVDTADVAALDGSHVAQQVRAYLGGLVPADGVRVLPEAPLRWISPGVLRPGDPAPARQRLLAWTDAQIRRPVITVRQDGSELVSKRLRWPAAPGRVFRIPSEVLGSVNPDGGVVTIAVR